MDTLKFCGSSGRSQGHLDRQSSVRRHFSLFHISFLTFLYLPFSNKKIGYAKFLHPRVWLSNINGLRNTDDGRQADYRSKGMPGERSSLLSLGTHRTSWTFAPRTAAWGPSNTISRFSQSKNSGRFQKPDLSRGGAQLWG